MLILDTSRSVESSLAMAAALDVQARYRSRRKENKIRKTVNRRNAEGAASRPAEEVRRAEPDLGAARLAAPTRQSSNTREGQAEMTQQGRWRRRLGICLLAALCLATGQGCLGFVHSLDFPPQEQVAQGEMVPAPSRNHVHIFLIHGMDPLDLANLNGLTEYVQQLGYIKTHYGQVYHFWEFKKEMRRIHQQDPQARFVLIGFSFGANTVRELANAVRDDGILIDLLVYLGGNTLENTPQTQPDHVIHVVNILAAGCIWNGTQMDRADNIHYTNVWHFGSPTHPRTRELLARELAVVAGRVPYVEKVPPLPPEVEDEVPMPRRVSPEQVRRMASELPQEWTFLNSRSAAGEAAPPPLARVRPSKGRRTPYSVMP
jgi:hypothetical protein